MDKFYPPYFPCYIPLPNGKPAAGGKLYAYYTGTDNLAPLYAEDGTILVGSVADIDSSGQVHVLLDPAITYRLKVVPPVGSQMPDQIYDNVRVANGTIVGMENPMTAEGDLIVGGAGGEPARLGVGSAGQVLTSDGTTWAPAAIPTQPGDHKVLGDVGDNSPDVLKEKLIALAPLSKDVLNAAGNKMVRFQLTKGTDGQVVKTYTDGGQLKVGWQTPDHLAKGTPEDTHPGDVYTKMHAVQPLVKGKLNASDGDGGVVGQTSISIDADGVPSGRVLTTDGDDGCGWEAPTGDHKVIVDGADASPDYLAAKLAAGTGISLTNTGSAVEIAADAQTGDHQLLVSATDAAAGYLGAKLTAGANVTLTTNTDGDGVQTLEISATGGGGGGGIFYPVGQMPTPGYVNVTNLGTYGVAFCFRLQAGLVVKKIELSIPRATAYPAFFDAATFLRSGNDFNINWHPTWTTTRTEQRFVATAGSAHTIENSAELSGEELMILVGHAIGQTNVDFDVGYPYTNLSSQSVSGADYSITVANYFSIAMCFYTSKINSIPATFVRSKLVAPSGTYVMPWVAIHAS